MSLQLQTRTGMGRYVLDVWLIEAKFRRNWKFLKKFKGYSLLSGGWNSDAFFLWRFYVVFSPLPIDSMWVSFPGYPKSENIELVSTTADWRTTLELQISNSKTAHFLSPAVDFDSNTYIQNELKNSSPPELPYLLMSGLWPSQPKNGSD